MQSRLWLFIMQSSAVQMVGCGGERSVDPLSVAGPTAVVLSAPPVAAPSNAGATAVSETTIDIVWLDKSDNESGFEVHRSPSGATGTYTLLTTTAANATGHRDMAVASATQYCYQVRAVRVSGNRKSYSSFSNTACATTAPPPPPPPPPPPSIPEAASGVGVYPASSNSVGVGWVDNSSNEDGFRVYRSGDGGSTWVLASTETAGNRGTIVYGETERLNCYRVVAFNVTGESPPSNTGCTTPPAGPPNPIATVLDTDVELTWIDGSAVEDGYQVWIYTASCCTMACNGFDPYAGEWLLAELPANSTRVRIATPGACYQLWVVAMKDGGNSDRSYFALP
jgi:hypothetical protein